jgi:hypothetical protein
LYWISGTGWIRWRIRIQIAIIPAQGINLGGFNMKKFAIGILLAGAVALPAFANPVGIPMGVAPRPSIGVLVSQPIHSALSAYRQVRTFWISRGIVR